MFASVECLKKALNKASNYLSEDM